MKKIIIVLLVIIGTLIGAGFASGKEIYIFFFKYGNMGLIGLLISCLLIGITTYIVFKIVNKRNIKSYEELLSVICESKKRI